MTDDRPSAETTSEKAAFAAGCFWGVEMAFRELPGVIDTRVGYQGGDMEKPSYEAVCSGTTGHAETVEVVFDPSVVAYETLLDTFFANHDPTQVNRQGPDVGTQYRSVIFAHTDEQEEAARAGKDALDATGRFSRPVATEIVRAPEFWEAEDYHQQYLEKRKR
ncbi:MAG: peptide-methionine (S)-S-oxide reductase MsrA [Acidimicrobiia bacterium]|nr:peptide-methionine (S)-S-oxide reductase MsrA [Acidimicrobiia bacterium]